MRSGRSPDLMTGIFKFAIPPASPLGTLYSISLIRQIMYATRASIGRAFSPECLFQHVKIWIKMLYSGDVLRWMNASWT